MVKCFKTLVSDNEILKAKPVDHSSVLLSGESAVNVDRISLLESH